MKMSNESIDQLLSEVDDLKDSVFKYLVFSAVGWIIVLVLMVMTARHTVKLNDELIEVQHDLIKAQSEMLYSERNKIVVPPIE